MNPIRWLDRLSDEGHASERLAMRWHTLHACLRVVVGAMDLGEILFHWSARKRHQRAADEKRP